MKRETSLMLKFCRRFFTQDANRTFLLDIRDSVEKIEFFEIDLLNRTVNLLLLLHHHNLNASLRLNFDTAFISLYI